MVSALRDRLPSHASTRPVVGLSAYVAQLPPPLDKRYSILRQIYGSTSSFEYLQCIPPFVEFYELLYELFSYSLTQEEALSLSVKDAIKLKETG